MNDDRLLLRRLLVRFPEQFFNPMQQILHSTDFSHVLCSKSAQLLGHIVRVHILVHRDYAFLLAGRDEFEKPAPLVFDPHSVKILVVRTDNDHHLCRVQGSEYVRLVLYTELSLERNTGEENAIPLFCKSSVYVLCDHAVRRAVSVLVQFLIGDEHVIRLLFAGYLQNALAQRFDLPCFFTVYPASNGVGILTCLLKIAVILHALKAGAVTGRDFLSRCGIVHIFDSVFAEDQSPIRLSLFREIGNDALKHARSLIKLAGAQKLSGSGKQLQLFLIVQLGDGLFGTAVFAFADSGIRNNVEVPAAHFTFDDRHDMFLFSLKILRKIYR